MQHVTLQWQGEHRFDSGRPDGPLARIDASGATGQGPTDALLTAVGACSAIDVIEILGKRRTPVQRLTVDVTGRRRDTPPRRYTHITVRFMVDGPDIEAPHAERAIALSFEKYCSVTASLASDIVLEAVLVLNGTEHPPTRHHAGQVPPE